MIEHFQREKLSPRQQKLDDLSVATFRKREKLKDDINKIFVKKFEKRPIEIFPDVLIGGSKKCGTIAWMFKSLKKSSFKIFKMLFCKVQLTLIWGFWDHHRACFLEKKSRIITGNVIVGIETIEIICADRVFVELSCDANFNGICQYV